MKMLSPRVTTEVFFRGAGYSLALMLLLMFPFSAEATAENSRKQDPVTLQLKWTHAFQFAGYYAALEKGYYREAGLDVTLAEATPGVDPIQTVLEGRAQFGVGTSSLLLERKAGKPVVALAVIFQHSPYVLIARHENATQGIHDLVGKRVMMEPQSEELLAYLQAEGVPLNRLTRIPHSFDLQDLIDGRVDAISAYVINQPYYLDRANIPHELYTPRSAGIDFYGDNLFTTEQELRDHPARVKAFRAASLQGWQYAMAHQEEIADLILARYSQRHSRDYLLFQAQQMLPLLRPELIEIGYMYPGRWRHIAETYADLGMMKANFDLNGFLYDPHPHHPDLTWLYAMLGLAVFGIAGILAVTFYIARTNARLRQKVIQHEQAEEALRASEERYCSILNASPDAITITDLDGRILTVSPAGFSIFGYKPEEKLAGRSITEFVAPENRDRVLANLTVLRQGALTGPSEYRGLRADGSHFDFEVNSDVLRTAEGKPVNMIFVLRNIAERKKAEAYREMGREILQILNEPDDLQNALQRILATLKTRSECDSAGLRLQDGDDFPYFTQEGFPKSFLLTENSLLAHDEQDGLCRDQDGKVRLECTCGLVISGKTDPSLPIFTRGGSFWINNSFPLLDLPAAQDPRFRPRNQCMREGYASMALVPIRSKDRIVGLLHLTDRRKDCFSLETIEILEGIASHIGAALMRKKAETEKAKLEAVLHQAQKMESVGRLAGGVAHDFNNMLLVIQGYTELALEQTDPAQPIHGSLTEIRNATKRAADLTRQLQTFARKLVILPKVLALNDIITDMFNLLRRLIGEDIQLIWQPAAELWPVKIDPSQFNQLLATLCLNARDSITGVGKIFIETRNATLDDTYCAERPGVVPGEYVRIAVSDTGCGMDENIRAHIFEPFFNSRSGGKGNGLGLASVYGAVKQNGGFINAYSEPGQGASFSIYLPRHHEKDTPAPKTAPAEIVAGGHETILVAEDEPAILKTTTILLTRLGYTVLAANSPAEAIRLAKEHAGEIRLLLSDVVMPEMNGRDLAKTLLALDPHLKLLFMSGYPANVIAQNGVLDAGLNFIQKPFSKQDLADKVRDVLNAPA